MNSKSYKLQYLKYKSKYINLKNQLGGAIDLNELNETNKCETFKQKLSLESGVYNKNCPNSIYNFTDFEVNYVEMKCEKYEAQCKELNLQNTKTDAANCLKCIKHENFRPDDDDETRRLKILSSRYNNYFEINQNCYTINLTQQYFKQSPNHFTETICINNLDHAPNDITEILLDTTKYSNESLNTDIIRNKDLFCAEGNIIYTDESCKVGSGGITSCLFMILVFDDNSYISCHMNGLITSNHDNYIRKQIKYPFSHDNCFKYIKEKYSDKIQNIKTIYL